jgi:hypothetical protein
MKIISGGQSGVDRAALDAALALELGYGGWCPHGGWAEDFPHPPGVLQNYPLLRETPLADPAQRTEWNVRDADATLILVEAGGLAASRGTVFAHAIADKYRKPVLIADLGAPDALALVTAWLRALIEAHGRDLALGIGGPRESEAPGIYGRARRFIEELLTEDG